MINIVTVYNSLNPGSLLQATMLYDKISEKYDDVYFLKIGGRHPYLAGIKLSLKLLKSFKFKYAFYQLVMPFKYNKILKMYKINKNNLNDDIYILGSDEIWNISRKNKILKHKIFFGEGLNCENCISYAPSINNSTVEQFKEFDFAKNNINKFHSISVRDTHSKNVISEITDRNVEIVCDPTMLFPMEKYRDLEEKINIKDYIFVYGSPSRFSENMKKEIIKFAKENNKKLVTYFFRNDWCDEIIYGSPYKFVSLISNADYVFTNTFHGTIFSIIYNKKFIAFDNNNRKVNEILNQFNLNVRYTDNMNIKEKLNEDYNYQDVNNKIKEIRESSEKYLFDSIDSIYNKK